MLIEEVKSDFCESIRKLCQNSRIVSDMIKSMCRICDCNIRKLSRLSKEINKHSITMPKDRAERNFESDFEKVYVELCDKNRISYIFKLVHPECRYIIEECMVDNMPLGNMDQAVIIALFLEINNLIKDTATVWNNTIKPYGGPIVNETLQGVTELEMPLERLIRVIREDKQIREDCCSKKAI